MQENNSEVEITLNSGAKELFISVSKDASLIYFERVNGDGVISQSCNISDLQRIVDMLNYVIKLNS